MSNGEKKLSILERLYEIKKIAEENFRKLNPQQLSWKSSDSSWSIAECLQHLITSNEPYFPTLDKFIAGNNATFWERYNPFSKIIGKNMTATLGREVVKKFKSTKLFVPSKISVREFSIDKFIAHQEVLIAKLSQMKDLSKNKTIISSPVSPLITFPLSDCLEIITGHEERHLNQAIRVMGHENFPVDPKQ